MLNHSSRPKRPRDVNQLAKALVDLSTGQAATDPASEPVEAKPPEHEKNPAAVSLGRRGGLKGGKARAESLTPEKRSEIARKAAAARWEHKD